MDGGNRKEMFNAACQGDIELVKYHVKNGVDVNYAHPEFLSTPLVACTLSHQEEIALYLLESGADPHLPSEFDALTPLQAAQQSHLHTLEAKLKQLGAVGKQPSEAKASKSWLRRVFARSAA